VKIIAGDWRNCSCGVAKKMLAERVPGLLKSWHADIVARSNT
jgi:hypothetical protein